MIYLGADHGGYELKERVKKWLVEWKEAFEDLGAERFDSSDDYPVFAKRVAQRVAGEDERSRPWKERAKGILVCRSGGGMVIAANRFEGVRAVYVFDEESARHAREHNDANVISLAADWIDEETARKVVKVWLETEFSQEARHERRIGQIDGGGVDGD